MLKVEPIQIDRIFGKSPSCLDDIVATYANYHNLNYELMFLEAWDFVFNRENSSNKLSLGDRIQISYYNRYSLLNKYHGISLIQHNFSDVNKFISEINSELINDFPVAIHFDAFYCPWDRLYNTYHNNHLCLVVGIDLDNNNLLITDPYNHISNQWVSLETVSKACKLYYTFKVCQNFSQKNNNVELLYNSMINLTTKNRPTAFSDIRMFANAVKECYRPEEEFKNGDIFGSNLFKGIVNKVLGRGLFYTSFKYIAQNEKSSDLLQLADSFKIMVSNWNLINSIFIKSLHVKNVTATADRISKRLVEEADYEEDTAYRIIEILNGKCILPSSNKNQNSIDCEKKDYIFLDLNQYYNNKGFGNEETISNSDLTGLGEFFLDINAPSNSIISQDNLSFKFPLINDEKNDNISCLSQVISVPPTRCREILFLGCSEYGSYYVTAEIQYSDGFSETIKIGLSDLAYEPEYAEHVIWKGKTVSNKDKDIEVFQQNAKIYGISIPLQYSGLIRGVKLPDCPNMHIFAISLSKQL